MYILSIAGLTAWNFAICVQTVDTATFGWNEVQFNIWYHALLLPQRLYSSKFFLGKHFVRFCQPKISFIKYKFHLIWSSVNAKYSLKISIQFVHITTTINTDFVAKLCATAFVAHLAGHCSRFVGLWVRFLAGGLSVAFFATSPGWVLQFKILTLKNYRQTPFHVTECKCQAFVKYDHLGMAFSVCFFSTRFFAGKRDIMLFEICSTEM